MRRVASERSGGCVSARVDRSRHAPNGRGRMGRASEKNIENVLRVFVCIHKRLEDFARETARELTER